MADEQKIIDGLVVSMQYVLHVNGELIDQSEAGEPLEFIQGAGHIIPGLERELLGMGVGESKAVTVAAADGYGEVDEEAFIEVPRDQFPDEVPAEVGLELQVRTEEGQTMAARIFKVTDESIVLDLNHPLAGKQLNFQVEITGLRAASEEELEHGHVHSSHHGHDHSHHHHD